MNSSVKCIHSNPGGDTLRVPLAFLELSHVCECQWYIWRRKNGFLEMIQK